MNETTDNFWEAFQSWAPEPPKPVYFRLYHDDQGAPICYSHEDLPGNYIDVTPLDFAISNMRVKVIKGQLVQLSTQVVVKKLIPNNLGTPCYIKDVSIVVPETETNQRWKIKSYEAN